MGICLTKQGGLAEDQKYPPSQGGSTYKDQRAQIAPPVPEKRLLPDDTQAVTELTHGNNIQAISSGDQLPHGAEGGKKVINAQTSHSGEDTKHIQQDDDVQRQIELSNNVEANHGVHPEDDKAEPSLDLDPAHNECPACKQTVHEPFVYFACTHYYHKDCLPPANKNAENQSNDNFQKVDSQCQKCDQYPQDEHLEGGHQAFNDAQGEHLNSEVIGEHAVAQQQAHEGEASQNHNFGDSNHQNAQQEHAGTEQEVAANADAHQEHQQNGSAAPEGAHDTSAEQKQHLMNIHDQLQNVEKLEEALDKGDDVA